MLKRALLSMMAIVMLVVMASIAFAKTETTSDVTGASVAYGKTGAGVLVPMKVDVNGAVYTNMGSISQSIIPAANNTYDLGSLTNTWGTLYGNKVRLAGTGSIGIGTAAPNSLLDVGGGIKTYITGTYDILAKGNLEVDTNAYVQGNTFLLGSYGLTVGSPYVVSNITGGSPAKLTLYNSTTSNSTYIRIHSNSSTDNVGQAIDFSNSTDQSLYGARIAFYRKGGSSLGDLAFFTNQTGATPSVVPERMRILSTGNIGVGTSAPVYKLEVNGQIYGSLQAYTATAPAFNVDGGIYYDSANKRFMGRANGTWKQLDN